MLDSDLLLEKSALLEKEGRIDEFIDTVRTLLSQHCPIIRDRDEAKCEYRDLQRGGAPLNGS